MMKRSGGNGIGVTKYEAYDIKRESDVDGKNVDNVTHKIKILGHFFLYVSMLIDQKKN